jgi:hypothetical protein
VGAPSRKATEVNLKIAATAALTAALLAPATPAHADPGDDCRPAGNYGFVVCRTPTGSVYITGGIFGDSHQPYVGTWPPPPQP